MSEHPDLLKVRDASEPIEKAHENGEISYQEMEKKLAAVGATDSLGRLWTVGPRGRWSVKNAAGYTIENVDPEQYQRIEEALQNWEEIGPPIQEEAQDEETYDMGEYAPARTKSSKGLVAILAAGGVAVALLGAGVVISRQNTEPPANVAATPTTPAWQGPETVPTPPGGAGETLQAGQWVKMQAYTKNTGEIKAWATFIPISDLKQACETAQTWAEELSKTPQFEKSDLNTKGVAKAQTADCLKAAKAGWPKGILIAQTKEGDVHTRITLGGAPAYESGRWATEKETINYTTQTNIEGTQGVLIEAILVEE